MPGTLYPRDLPRYTESPVEPDVFEALRDTLPDTWTAWHSLRFAYGPYRSHREIDFVVLVPGRGILVLEVKGGSDWRCEDGHWYHRRERVGRGRPLDQALSANAAMRVMLEETLGEPLPPSFVALCFPQVSSTHRPTASDLAGRVFLAGDTPQLGEGLAALAEQTFPTRRPEIAWDRVREALHRAWGETWVPSLHLSRVQTERARVLVRLDAQQRLLARDTDVSGRLEVLGGPGSGKSLIAREAIARFTAEGRSPLFLCYTRALAAGMRREGLREAYPVREFARKVLQDNAVALPPGDSSTWKTPAWESMMATAAELVAAADLQRPSVLVVDEAQDFGGHEWAIVEALAPRGTPLLAFGDPEQTVLAHGNVGRPGFDVSLRLRGSYRTPAELLDLANRVRRGASLHLEESPHYHAERLRGDPVTDGVRRAVEWLLKRGVAAADIAALSVKGRSGMTRPPPGVRIAGERVADADGADAHDAVVWDTAVRFKGLERPWVVLFDVESLDAPGARNRAYVGITRATMGLVVVGP
jgi:hypothetical protein